MQLKPLGLEQAKEIYKKHIRKDFPLAERKPFWVIRRLSARGLYRCYGLFSGGQLQAYGFFVRPKNGGSIMLDYFAVVSGNRGGGLGSRFLALVPETLGDCSSLIIEVESRRAARSEAQLKTRERRISFYLRNGFFESGVLSRLFGVSYEVMALPLQQRLDDRAVFVELSAIYDTLFGRRRGLFSKITPAKPQQH